MTGLLTWLKADALATPAALVALVYAVLQIRKLWFDSAKSACDAEKAIIELRELRKQSLQVAELSSRDPKKSEEEVSQDRHQVVTRQDLLIFAPFMLFTFSMFIWRGSNAANERQLFFAIHSGLIFALTFQLFVLVIGLHMVSRMLLASDRFTSHILPESVKSTSTMLLESSKSTSDLLVDCQRSTSDMLLESVKTSNHQRAASKS